MKRDSASVPTVVLSDYVGQSSRETYASYAREFGLRLIAPDGEDNDRLNVLLPEADYLLVRRRSISVDVLPRASRLRALVGIGERVRFSAKDFTQRGIEVIFTPRLTAMAVADLVLCQILVVSRNLLAGHRGVTDGAYRNLGLSPQPTSETQIAFNWLDLPGDAPLYGRVLGLVGMGEIGALIARRATACGMRVLYHQRSPLPPDDERQLGVQYAPLDELLTRCDFLSLHVPDSASTKHLIDAAAIASMKPTAYLINASRGRVVDENALFRALSERKLAGAALDVFRYEPLPADSPLIGLPNLFLTPHLGGGNASVLMKEMQTAFARIADLHGCDGRHNPELSVFGE